MPGQNFSTNRYGSPDQVKSVVSSYDDAVSQTVPLLRFPSTGRVLAAYLFASESSSGTNLIQAAIKNGGPTGAGTIVTAPLTNGTVLAGSAYALSVATDGKDIYAAGDYCMLQIVTTMAKTNVDVQVDYWVDPLG